ncbi:uncharacterized protein LOC131327452 [Rhododendron vialii]|uniref:uncharacterized protein LOC131327452 n=1 Tax=Rhododendron vialii TaxID=182163 RepID=UPI00265F7A7C|nr:uncharacterized protein LOC131327452 [Rhododendron vialii]
MTVKMKEKVAGARVRGSGGHWRFRCWSRWWQMGAVLGGGIMVAAAVAIGAHGGFWVSNREAAVMDRQQGGSDVTEQGGSSAMWRQRGWFLRRQLSRHGSMAAAFQLRTAATTDRLAWEGLLCRFGAAIGAGSQGSDSGDGASSLFGGCFGCLWQIGWVFSGWFTAQAMGRGNLWSISWGLWTKFQLRVLLPLLKSLFLPPLRWHLTETIVTCFTSFVTSILSIFWWNFSLTQRFESKFQLLLIE